MARKKAAGAESKAPKLEVVPPPPEVAGKIAKQTYEIRAVSELRLHPRNARRGDVDAIGASIERNDFYGAAVVQKSTGYILVGNHRYKGAVAKGLPAIPIILVDCDDETAERIMLADNRIADLADYDGRALLALLEDHAKSGGLSGTGFGDADLAKLQAKANPPESFPEFNGQVTVKYKCPHCSFEWS
jgi:hypothetical protein